MLRLTGDGTFTETVPVLDDRGHMTPTEVEDLSDVDVAIQWNAGYDTITRSFVNVIATPHHGTHVTGFDRAIVRTLNEQLRAARILRNGDEPVTKEDILEGLTSIISVRLPEPQFEGQTKEVLGTPAATAIVSQVVRTQLKNYFENPPRGAKQQAKAVLDKVASAAKTRVAAREHRENQRRKSALASSSLPAKLVDCRSADDRSELFIVEATPPWAPPSWQGTPSSRRCCRSAARSSTCRSRAWPTCSRTPSAPPSSRSSALARAPRSTWTRRGTSG